MKLSLVLVLAVIAVPNLKANDVVYDPALGRYLDALALTGQAERSTNNYSIRGVSSWGLLGEGHPWNRRIPEATDRPATLRWTPIRLHQSYNSSYPSGFNDASAWQGRGYNASLVGGVRWTPRSWVDLTIAPRVWFAENRDFPTIAAVNGEFGYYVGGVDVFQRPGAVSQAKIDYGESSLHVRYRGVSFGVSASSQWYGPAREQPIILGSNAAGIPRAEITLLPARTRIGEIEATVSWGILSESESFDENTENDLRFAALLATSLRPAFVPNLTLGFHRFSQSPWKSATLGNVLDPFTTRMSTALGDDDKDQRVALTVEWTFPQVGFAGYLEWARNDYSPNWRYIIREPKHSQAYTIGVRQAVLDHPRRLLVVYAEFTELIHSRDYYIDLGMSQRGFYHHGIVSQGHTNAGQILGAGIGPGADSQVAGADLFVEEGSVGVEVRRIARNKDFLYGAPDAGPGDIRRMNVEMQYLVRGALWLRPELLLTGSLAFARNINWNFVEANDRNNVRLQIGVSWQREGALP